MDCDNEEVQATKNLKKKKKNKCEFKKGDRIVCINEDNHEELKKGKIYEVDEPNGDFVYLKGCKYGYFTFLFRKECEYCKGRSLKEIDGKSFNLKPTAGFENDRKYNSWIMKSKKERKAGIMILTNGSNGVYFDINYCPICGRKVSD